MYWIRHQLGWTALYHAAHNGHIEVTKLLLDGGAAINVKNKVGDTTLEIMIVCITESILMTVGDSSVMAKSSSQRHCKHRYRCNLDSSQVSIIAHTS